MSKLEVGSVLGGRLEKVSPECGIKYPGPGFVAVLCIRPAVLVGSCVPVPVLWPIPFGLCGTCGLFMFGRKTGLVGLN
jgi:hypothetical protein